MLQETKIKMANKKNCVICRKEIIGYGNNAAPLKKGYCCDDCNLKFIIPIRLKAAQIKNHEKK